MICCRKTNFRSYFCTRIAACYGGSNSKKFQKIYKRMYKYAFSIIGDIAIEDVTSTMLNRILNNALRKDKDGYRCYKEIRDCLDFCFRYAQDRRWIGRVNPVDEVMNVPPPIKPIRIFTDNENARIFDACRDFRFAPFVRGVHVYGIEADRLAAMDCSDIDKCNKYIHITKYMKKNAIHILDSGQQDIPVDDEGIQDFSDIVRLGVRSDDFRRIESAMRFRTGIEDFSFRICVNSFIIRMLQSGITPVDLRFYYGAKNASKYFNYMKYLDLIAPGNVINDCVKKAG